MSPIVLALVIFAVVMLLLALFAGRGAGETVQPPSERPSPSLAGLTLPDLTRVLRDAFTARGFAVVSESQEPRHSDLLLRDASPLTGQTIYVRCLVPPDGAAVESVEVQAALDRIHGEQLEKAVVATPGQFSSEALVLARESNVELLDGPALAELLARDRPRRSAFAARPAGRPLSP